jgi:hypothetical protein
MFKYYCPKDKLPIFSFLRTQSADFEINIEMLPVGGGAAAFSYTQTTPSGGNVDVFTYTDGTELIFHRDTSDYFDGSGSNSYPAFGDYYLRIEMNGSVIWYSEVFTYADFDSDDRDCYNLLYTESTCEIGSVYYQGYDKLYLKDSDIGLPEYIYVEEGEENSQRERTITFRKVEKIRQFTVVGTEYLCDYFSIIGLMDTITFTNAVETITISSATTTYEQMEGDCEQKITVRFLIDTASKVDCCVELDNQSISTPSNVDSVVDKRDCSESETFSLAGLVNGDRFLGCCNGNCFIYKVFNGQYILVDQDNQVGNVVFDSSTGYYWHYYSGGFNIRYLYLTQSGSNPNITLAGWCPDFYWLKLQRSIASVWTDQGSAIASATFADSGIAATSYTAGTWRYKLYNHSQTAYSNEITIV